MEMFTDLRQFEYAKVMPLLNFVVFLSHIVVMIFQIVKPHLFLSFHQDFVGSSDPKNVKQLIKKQAEWCETTNDSKAAV